jgi:hypothetical protein
MPAALGRLKQKGGEFLASLGYVVRSCLKKPRVGCVHDGPGFQPQHQRRKKGTCQFPFLSFKVLVKA